MKLHIVGSGPAGLAAAQAGLAAGAHVCLLDDNGAPGGQIWRGGPASWTDSRASRIWADLRDHPRLAHVRNAQVVARPDAGTLLLERDGQGERIRFERLIVCTGAREVFLPFPGWTLPGVTGAGGLQAMIKGGMPVRGCKVVVAGSGPLLLATAATALAAGAQVSAIVEHQPLARLSSFAMGLARRHRSKLRQAVSLFASLRKIPYLSGARIVEAAGVDGLQSVVVQSRRGRRELACDFLAAGFGLTPNTGPGQAFGCEVANDALVVDERQRTSAPGIWAAGECTGIGGVDKALIEGRIAALDALGYTPSKRELSTLDECRDFAALLARSFALDASLKAMCRPGTIVCRCEDVTASALQAFQGWREAKLSTRVGMGACQGKTCAPACAFLFGWDAPAPRTPFMPASAGALAEMDADRRRD